MRTVVRQVVLMPSPPAMLAREPTFAGDLDRGAQRPCDKDADLTMIRSSPVIGLMLDLA